MTELSRYLADWHPEPLVEHDDMEAMESGRFAALLGTPPLISAELPPLWHWFYFLGWPAQAGLGPDGHPLNGHFLPPIPNRRRMFAGGRLTVTQPLEFEIPAERRVRIANVALKQGRSGEIAFVTVRSDFYQQGELRVTEEQDAVYRSGAGPVRTFLPSDGEIATATWSSVPHLDETLLFRFSAITANAHRIHYDAPYTREVEGYPGLVVHGPLLVLLMLELVRDREVASVNYRLQHPVFLGDQITVLGDPVDGGAELSVCSGATANAVAKVSFR